METFEKFGNAYRRVYEFFKDKKAVSAVDQIKKKFSDPIKSVEDRRSSHDRESEGRSYGHSKHVTKTSEPSREQKKYDRGNVNEDYAAQKRKYPDSKQEVAPGEKNKINNIKGKICFLIYKNQKKSLFFYNNNNKI